MGSIRQEIMESFIAELERTPVDKVKVGSLMHAIGKPRTAFYRYFDDVEDLLEQVERDMLQQLVLYHSAKDAAAGEDELAGQPFPSMVRWFRRGQELRETLRALMGPNGDVYFRVRLLNQLRRNLNCMMDDESAPNDALRPYYVELTAAAHIGMLAHLVTIRDDRDLVDAVEVATIANSAREAYFGRPMR